MTRLLPGQDASPISLALINGATWSLTGQSDTGHPWRMIVVYRGLHCPVCKAQLGELKGQLKAFADAGVSVVAASMDTESRAGKTHEDWELGELPVAYGLTRAFAEKFGLYLSDPVSDNEPDLFTEPAILLFRGETLYTCWIQSIPFARPKFDDVLKGIKFIGDKDYPPRGKVK